MVLLFPEYPRPVPSFRAPVPAPDVEPTDAPLVSVCFNYQWLPYVLGALTQLTLWSTWAGMDEEAPALAMRRGASLIEAFALAYDNAACPTDMVPAPYWEDAEDSDDEAPADAQVWYGKMEGTTFVEDIGIWAITGFIVYSGNIGAAIAFKAFAPRFVLAWKQDGIAGAIRVFIDGVDNGLLDTNGDPDVIVEKDYVDILMVLESVPA
jgi:hypothetical protein